MNKNGPTSDHGVASEAEQHFKTPRRGACNTSKRPTGPRSAHKPTSDHGVASEAEQHFKTPRRGACNTLKHPAGVVAELQCGYNQKCSLGLRMSLCEIEIKHLKKDLEQLSKSVIKNPTSIKKLSMDGPAARFKVRLTSLVARKNRKGEKDNGRE